LLGALRAAAGATLVAASLGVSLSAVSATAATPGAISSIKGVAVQPTPSSTVTFTYRSPIHPNLTEVCKQQSNNPHTSGAAGVIFKTTETCTGDFPGVGVEVKGLEACGPSIGPGAPKATSDQTQYVKTGSTMTWYTPVTGAPAATGIGYWQGFSTGEIVSPGLGSIGSTSSQRVYINAGGSTC
jgi:hypothetical protein